MKALKIILNVFSILLWIWLFSRVITGKTPPFNTYPEFFIPAYRVFVICCLTFLLYRSAKKLVKQLNTE